MATTTAHSDAFGDGLGVARCNCPLIESEQQFQCVTNWTKTRGNHTFKFGADVRYAENLRVPSDSNRTGVYDFNDGNTSNARCGRLGFGTFLLGDVRSVSRYVSTSTNAAERQHRMFYYGEDSWRVTPKLTLNYGLRWEVYFPEYVNGEATRRIHQHRPRCGSRCWCWWDRPQRKHRQRLARLRSPSRALLIS